MWRIGLILGGLALLCGAVAAQPDSLSRQFETATAAYKQGQYARAADVYREILDTGHTNVALYYNLGNAYVRLDRLGQAIRYYEKARALRPNAPRLQHNLEQARRQAGVYPGRLPRAASPHWSRDGRRWPSLWRGGSSWAAAWPSPSSGRGPVASLAATRSCGDRWQAASCSSSLPWALLTSNRRSNAPWSSPSEPPSAGLRPRMLPRTRPC